MKKISIFLAFVLTLSVTLFSMGCKNKENNVIRINEVTHSVFYAPLYVAINKGYFEEEGLTIELTNGGGSDASMTALLSGSADIGLMGPETVVYVASQGKSDAPVIFGQLTKRDGSFLVGRNPEPNFDWSSLDGKHIIAGRKGGSPAMSLQVALEKNGYNIKSDLNFDLSIAFNMTVPAFTGGTGDYVTVFEPTASELVANGTGYIVASVGQESGEIPFTAFITTPSYLKDNNENCKKFLNAVNKAYKFIMSGNMEEIVDSLVPSFPDTSRTSIENSVKSYKSIDAWCSVPSMSSESFDKLQNMLISAGELTSKVEFSKCVDNTIANKIK